MDPGGGGQMQTVTKHGTIDLARNITLVRAVESPAVSRVVDIPVYPARSSSV